MLPDEVRAAVEAAAGPITAVESLGGSFGARLLRVTAGGASYALKWARDDRPAAMVAAEAHGLRTLAGAGAVRVPAAPGGEAPSSSSLEAVTGSPSDSTLASV